MFMTIQLYGDGSQNGHVLTGIHIQTHKKYIFNVVNLTDRLKTKCLCFLQRLLQLYSPHWMDQIQPYKTVNLFRFSCNYPGLSPIQTFGNALMIEIHITLLRLQIMGEEQLLS